MAAVCALLFCIEFIITMLLYSSSKHNRIMHKVLIELQKINDREDRRDEDQEIEF